MAERIELSKRQVEDIQGYVDRFRREDVDDEKGGIASEMLGYVNSAIHKQADPDRAE